QRIDVGTLVCGAESLRDDFGGGPCFRVAIGQIARCHADIRRNPRSVESRENWGVVVADKNRMRRQIAMDKSVVCISGIVQFSESAVCFPSKQSASTWTPLVVAVAVFQCWGSRVGNREEVHLPRKARSVLE